MKFQLAIADATIAVLACGRDAPPAEAPMASPSAAVAPAPAPAPVASTPASTPAPAPASDGMTTGVIAVSNEITTPNVVAPDKVIAALRPKLNACYQTGLAKNPKLEGSVTLSATIGKDGKVALVTPKNTTGLSPAVLKCLSEELKAATFAAAGGMNYTTSIDIPVAFSSH